MSVVSGGTLALIFAAVFILVLVATRAADRPYAQVETRMRRMLQRTRRGDTKDDILADVEEQDDGSPRDRLRFAQQRERLMRLVNERMAGEGFGNKLALRLRRADLKLQVAEFLLIAIGLAMLGIMVGWLIDRAFLGIVLGVFGAALPFIQLSRRTAKRRRMLEDQLADALGLISNSLRSGYSFLQAMDVVAKEAPAPIGREFEMVIRETRVNIPVEDALLNLVNRTQSADIDLTVTAMLIQRQVGGNMAEVMDNIGATIRDRAKLASEVRTLSTTGKMSGTVVACVPVALVLLISAVNPEFMSPLWTNPIGWAAIGIGLTMQAIGGFLISRIIKVKY